MLCEPFKFLEPRTMRHSYIDEVIIECEKISDMYIRIGEMSDDDYLENQYYIDNTIENHLKEYMETLDYYYPDIVFEDGMYSIRRDSEYNIEWKIKILSAFKNKKNKK